MGQVRIPYGNDKCYLGENVSGIYTDSLAAYRGLPYHDSVNHSICEWVKGNVHTSTVEQLWSTVKQAMRGTYNYVTPGYLSLYLKEIEWKYNNRRTEVWRATLSELMKFGNYVRYTELKQWSRR